MPSIVTTGALVVDDVLPSGDMAVHVHVDHAEARPQAGSKITGDAFAAQLKTYDGLTERGALTPTGHLHDAVLDAPNATAAAKVPLAQLADSLEQLALPLPGVAVGAGASWTTTKTIHPSGIQMTVTTTVALTALTADRIAYTTTTTVTAADQHADVGGIDIAVAHLAGGGSGAGSIDLATFALAGTFTTAFQFDGTSAGDPAATPISMKMTVAITAAR